MPKQTIELGFKIGQWIWISASNGVPIQYKLECVQLKHFSGLPPGITYEITNEFGESVELKPSEVFETKRECQLDWMRRRQAVLVEELGNLSPKLAKLEEEEGE